MGFTKKYNFERDEIIANSSLHYLKDLPYVNKHRTILARCDICDTIKPFRLYNIISGRVRTCGCMHREMLESGVLTDHSVRARKNKPWLQKGGWGYKQGGLLIHIPKRYLKSIGDITIGELMETIDEDS